MWRAQVPNPQTDTIGSPLHALERCRLSTFIFTPHNPTTDITTKIKTNSHDILKFSPLSLQLYGPSCTLPSFLRLVLSALSLSFLLCAHHDSAPGSVVFHSPRLLLHDLIRGVCIPATVNLHWIWLSLPAPPFMILAWFPLPSIATLSLWPLSLFGCLESSSCPHHTLKRPLEGDCHGQFQPPFLRPPTLQLFEMLSTLEMLSSPGVPPKPLSWMSS